LFRVTHQPQSSSKVPTVAIAVGYLKWLTMIRDASGSGSDKRHRPLLSTLFVIDLSIGVGHLAAAPVVKKECGAK
jgi:hypothetical protein